MGRQIGALLGVLLAAGLAAFITYTYMSRAPQQVVGNESGILTTERDFRDKITELRIHREKVLRGVKLLERRKSETVAYLKDKGIRSSADVTDDKDVVYALRNLKGWKTDIDKLNADVVHYDEAISSIEVMLDELERKRIDKEVALTDEQYVQLRKIVKDLNERLGMDKKDILEDDELSKLLDEELEKDAAKN